MQPSKSDAPESEREAPQTVWAESFTDEEADPNPVAVAYCYSANVSGAFADALASTFMLDRELIEVRISKSSGPRMNKARNEITDYFLHQTRAEWLWFVDTDMTWRGDTLRRLLATADPEERPIVGGLCFGKDPDDAWFPTMYNILTDGRLNRAIMWEPGSVIQVTATGAACILIHRSVLEHAWEQTEGKPWGDGRLGEDIAFCVKAVELGYPIFVDTSIDVPHIKPVAHGFNEYREFLARRRFVITGTGRCGTGYMSRIFQMCGVPVGHEAVFGPQTFKGWGLYRGDSSWLAAQFLDHLAIADIPIVHLVRDPIEVIRSLVGIKFFDDDPPQGHEPYLQPIRAVMPGVFDRKTPVARAAQFVHDWNRMIQDRARLRIRAEDMCQPDALSEFLELVAVHRDFDTLKFVLDQVPSNMNSRPRDENIGWSDLDHLGKLGRQMSELAEEYGYATTDGHAPS